MCSKLTCVFNANVIFTDKYNSYISMWLQKGGTVYAGFKSRTFMLYAGFKPRTFMLVKGKQSKHTLTHCDTVPLCLLNKHKNFILYNSIQGFQIENNFFFYFHLLVDNLGPDIYYYLDSKHSFT